MALKTHENTLMIKLDSASTAERKSDGLQERHAGSILMLVRNGLHIFVRKEDVEDLVHTRDARAESLQDIKVRAAMLSQGDKSDEGYALIGLKEGIAKIGLHGIEVPDGLERTIRHSARSLPVQTRITLSNLEDARKVALIYSMVSALHDGRILLYSDMRVKSEHAAQILPVELTDEKLLFGEVGMISAVIGHLGLDLSKEALDSSRASCTQVSEVTIEALKAKLRLERFAFLKKFSISSVDKLASFIQLYGRESSLLGRVASRCLQSPEQAKSVAREVVESLFKKDRSEQDG